MVKRQTVPPLDRGEIGSAVDAGPGRWLPTCESCDERGEVDEIDLVAGHVTIVCARCDLSWTEAFEGGVRTSIGMSVVARSAESRRADFSHFEHLERTAQATLMVRVLCGLVALEDEVPAPT